MLPLIEYAPITEIAMMSGYTMPDGMYKQAQVGAHAHAGKEHEQQDGLERLIDAHAKARRGKHDRCDRREEQATRDRVGDVVLGEKGDAAIDERADEKHDHRRENRAQRIKVEHLRRRGLQKCARA